MMAKVAVAGKVDPEILEALEWLKEREHLKNISRAVEFALRQYFCPQREGDGRVTFGYNEEKERGNAFSILERIDEIKQNLREVEKEIRQECE